MGEKRNQGIELVNDRAIIGLKEISSSPFLWMTQNFPELRRLSSPQVALWGCQTCLSTVSVLFISLVSYCNTRHRCPHPAPCFVLTSQAAPRVKAAAFRASRCREHSHILSQLQSALWSSSCKSLSTCRSTISSHLCLV